MTKIIATLPALALVVALSGSAVADNGIDSTTLADMGLTGVQVMDDSEAQQVRGLGYYGGGYHAPQPSGDKPWSLAFGVSYATVEGGNEWKSGGAGTLDGFAAEGKYMASGEHFSEAGVTKVESHELQVKGEPATLEIHTSSLRVFAGGFATASSL